MKKLAYVAGVIAVLSLIVCAVISLTTNGIVTNEIAIDQLNGGDEAYLVMQAHNQYKEIIYGISGCITVAAVTTMMLAFHKINKDK